MAVRLRRAQNSENSYFNLIFHASEKPIKLLKDFKKWARKSFFVTVSELLYKGHSLTVAYECSRSFIIISFMIIIPNAPNRIFIGRSAISRLLIDLFINLRSKVDTLNQKNKILQEKKWLWKKWITLDLEFSYW